MTKFVKKFSTENSVQNYDVLCFSHLRWDFVYQRPQHLLSRFAQSGHRVFFIEEPIIQNGEAKLEISQRAENLFIVTPQMPFHTDENESNFLLNEMLNNLVTDHQITNFISWYYTPMMLSWSEHLSPVSIVYDSMDELSLFKFAPPSLLSNEEKLFNCAKVVFTGGQSLFEAKQSRHPNIHAFPSSIDAKHFAKALEIEEEPPDQISISRPRVGYYGVIDERIDLNLLNEIARLRPDYQFIMIGPVVKIDEADLPRRANIHYLGGKNYEDLPLYLSGWDVAIMPFALNDSTKFISPTKTPEYLAAGKPVVSTPIRDVIRPYGENGLAQIAADSEEFAAALDKAMGANTAEHQQEINNFLSNMSWDKTFAAMKILIDASIGSNKADSIAAGDK